MDYCVGKVNTNFKEFDLMREVLFALQGLNGRIIRQDVDGRFTITKSHIGMIDPTQRMLLEKLTSFGWLVNKIKNHINLVNKDPSQGKVSQCLAAALNNELLEYYHMVTQIEQKLQSQQIPSVTLHQIHVWSLDHYFRLKTLAMLVECCKGERGGHLARIVYRFMQQGDKQIRAIITRILSQIVLPIRHMLSQWIFHGEIQDPYDEFFICLDDHVAVEGLTSSVTMMSLSYATLQTGHLTQYQQTNNDSKHYLPHHIQPLHRPHHLPISSSMTSLSSTSADEKKYIINDYMMPGFITRQQANKILATGKAIHLLRKVCADSIASSVPGYDDLKKSFESTNIESLFRSMGISNCEENEFENLLNTAYKEVSQKALALLFGNYKLRSHFRGLRQYLLLGQGDFIRHLMDLLGTELDKPSSECRFHNILSVLDSAMRSTNAQFDEPDVTNRLDCRLLDASSSQATGWDIFSLVYKVDGPISTIFTEEKIRDYIDIFRQLWRTKRVEHVLTSIWSNQMLYSKLASNIPSVSSVLHTANILLSSMIHFMQHFQNFIMFEVVECSWVELVAATDVAKDVDDVIAAHDSYLRKIKSGIMCQKDMLFDCIWEFQHLMTSLWRHLDGELCDLPKADLQFILSDYQTKIQAIATKFQMNRQIKLEKQPLSENLSKF
uniref:Gamma-tubulin complex component 3 n=1 Tax=Aceria tosichella TaxID=561515 RepID=A0A6G1S4E0_9ACAR